MGLLLAGARRGLSWLGHLSSGTPYQCLAGAAPSDPTDLRDDLKFSEIVAATLGSLRELRGRIAAKQDSPRSFRRRVRELLASDDSEALLARVKTELTVCFVICEAFRS